MTTSPFKGGLQADIDRDPLREEIHRLRAALEEIATRTTRELAAHSARIARATLDGEDWR